MMKEDDIVLINGKEYTLGARIGGGLEGSIFDVKKFPDNKIHNSNYVIKIINDNKMTKIQKDDVYKHLKWLYDLGARNGSIKQILTVPKALLDEQLGYIMLKADEHDCLKKYIDAPNDMSNFEDWYKHKYTLKKRYQIIINLFDALRELHLAGLVFTDLSPNNIMVHQNRNQIVFIDTDNTRNRLDSYLGVLGTPGYMAPEVYREPNLKLANKYKIDTEILSNCGRITPDSDIFSAAIIAFQLLTLQHPFIGDEVENGTPEQEEDALRIKTDYIFKEGTSNKSESNLVPYFNDLTTKEIRELFCKTFVEGRDNPHLRPTDNDFLEAFQKAYDTIVECPKCGYSRLYSFEDGANKCINCSEGIGPKIVLYMYNSFKDMNRADLINSIGDFPKLNVDIENLKDLSGKEPNKFIEISKIILEPGKEKYLYLRHFEENTKRSEKYAKIILSPEETLSVKILNKTFENPYLYEKKKRKHIAINDGKENIKYDKYAIFFDTKKQGKGFLSIFCTLKKV